MKQILNENLSFYWIVFIFKFEKRNGLETIFNQFFSPRSTCDLIHELIKKIFKKNRKLQRFYWNNPGLTSIEEKCLSYSFIYEVYGKNAYHTIFMYENYKIVISS